MRLQRALARAGIASRRQSEALIEGGRVTVNGKVAELGQSVDAAHDDIRVDGKRVSAPAESVWILLHKPQGVMTTRRDPEGRKTVFDLVEHVPGLVYVGRLDYLTEGLLLLTNDGATANRLTHPSYEVEREYLAIVKGNVEVGDDAGLALVGATPALAALGVALGLIGRRRGGLRWLAWIAIVLGVVLVIASIAVIAAVTLAFRTFS